MNRTALALLIAGPLSGCALEPTTDVGSGADPLVTVGGCSTTTPELCAYPAAGAPTYTPDPSVPVQDLSYLDITGAQRSFQIALRAPVGAPEPLPVVVWSHGGNDGRARARQVGVEWADILVRAGYLVIDIAHPSRGPISRAALCHDLGISVIDCVTFKHLHWDRPHDAARVFDFIEAQAVSGPLAGRIDASHIVYAGHSAGAGSAEMVNGATRDMGGVSVALPDPRPVAFLTNSPEGPGDDGFTDTSYGGCARPMLVNSGVGDDTNVFGEDRARVFDLAPAGDKYRLFVLDEAARHATFDQSADACEDYSTARGLDPARCAAFKAWIAWSAVAFLDAHARGSADAQAYLASDNLAVAADGLATWDRK